MSQILLIAVPWLDMSMGSLKVARYDTISAELKRRWVFLEEIQIPTLAFFLTQYLRRK